MIFRRMSSDSPYHWIQQTADKIRPTPLPCRATICPEPGWEYEVIVWPDWIEEVEPEVSDPLWEPDRESFDDPDFD